MPSPPSSENNEKEKKYTRAQLVNTIKFIDSLLVMLVLFVAWLLYYRYFLKPSPLPQPPFPRDEHSEDFTPLDEDGKIEICEHFLSYEEIDSLLELIDGDWKQSSTGGANYLVPSHKSWKNKMAHSTLIQTIEERIAKVTNIPIHKNEDMLHMAKIKSLGTNIRDGNYPPFGLHHDTDTRPWRHKTLLVYLTTINNGGGKTIFPLSIPLNKKNILNVKMSGFRKSLQKQLMNEKKKWNRQVTFPLKSTHKYMDLIESSCLGQIGVSISPVAGTAIMFDHLIDNNNYLPNVNMWHAGCNVIDDVDEKIILQKFKEKRIYDRKNVYVQKDSQRTSIFKYNSYDPSTLKVDISKKDEKKRKNKKKKKEALDL